MADALHGRDLWGNPIVPPSRGKVSDKFLIPPFSVLNARDGFWQERKRAWIGLGIASEVGRTAKTFNIDAKTVFDADDEPEANDAPAKRLLLPPTSDTGFYTAKRKKEAELGKELTTEDFLKNHYEASGSYDAGTSIFDPVLCELAYRWWCPAGGTILDPFAGGSVRGIVATSLGRKYWGCDLRQEQVDANVAQGKTIVPDAQPTWVVGDSAKKMIEAPACDFVFSCPPYGDLEVYSDDPADLSTMAWSDFLDAYSEIIRGACARLKEDRFAAFVVGDFRDKAGFMRNFVSATISIFEEAGLRLYNEVILMTAVGSLSIRVTKQFQTSRKIGKTHQNLLVFFKGDPGHIKRDFGPLEGPYAGEAK